MVNRDLIFALHEINGVGWKSIDQLMSLNIGTRIQNGLMLEKKDWIRLGLKEKTAAQLQQGLSLERVNQLKKRYASLDIHYMTRYDEDYPVWLEQIHQPPWVIYMMGDRHLLHQPSIAVVGTRKPTYYGRKAATDLSKELSNSGLTIVSGLAKGIDAAAHWGALQGDGKSIAVLGTGLDIIYPAANEQLAERLKLEGLIISEYPLYTPMHPGLFPRRNRIIAGLTRGTLVVEAAEKSGSLITADIALEENRDVFAVPGPIQSVQSQGTLSLIQQGASMVIRAEDIIQEYSDELHSMTVLNTSSKDKNRYIKLSEDEQYVIQFLSADPITLDELMMVSKLTFGHLHSVLLHLHMKNKVESLPGSRYVLL